jgi:uncharacterized protein YeaO (DUF488 family)
VAEGDRADPGAAHMVGHDPARFVTFRDRYRRELDANPDAVAELCGLIDQGDVTLLYAAHDEQANHAVVLAGYLGDRGYAVRR